MTRCRISAGDYRVQQVVSSIAQNPCITVRKLARQVNLSSSRLGHLFKAQTGKELRHFLLDARLEKAAELLRKTEMQVKAISHIVGYQHLASFDRIFKKKFKLAPADYRRQQFLSPSVLLLGAVAHPGSQGNRQKG